MKKKGGVTSGKIVFGNYMYFDRLSVEGVDASSVDVYQDCQACFFIVDPRNVYLSIVSSSLAWISRLF